MSLTMVVHSPHDIVGDFKVIWVGELCSFLLSMRAELQNFRGRGRFKQRLAGLFILDKNQVNMNIYQMSRRSVVTSFTVYLPVSFQVSLPVDLSIKFKEWPSLTFFSHLISSG